MLSSFSTTKISHTKFIGNRSEKDAVVLFAKPLGLQTTSGDFRVSVDLCTFEYNGDLVATNGAVPVMNFIIE